MKWFGSAPWAPACEPDQRIEVPVGAVCVLCKETITALDSGFGMMDPQVTHRECMFRSVMGSPKHLLGRCTCPGSARLVFHFQRSPDLNYEGMTYREEARWVWKTLVV